MTVFLCSCSQLDQVWTPCTRGEGNGNPLQYSCLENPVDRGAWWAAVHRVAQSRTRLKQLSMHACIGEGNGNPFQYSCLENPRDRGAWWAAIYGSHRVGYNWSDLAAAAVIYLTPYWNGNLHALTCIFYLLYIRSHLKSSFFLHHSPNTILSKVRNNLWIVRCNDFFDSLYLVSSLYNLTVLSTFCLKLWLLWNHSLVLWLLVVWSIQSFTATSFLRVGVKGKSCSSTLFSPHTMLAIYTCEISAYWVNINLININHKAG